MKFSRQETTVLKAILRTRRGPGSPVLIQDVIKAISYYSKETTKRALISLAEKGVVALSSHDFPQSMTSSERKYFIREKGTGRRRIGGGYDDRYYHAVVIRDDRSLPEEVKNPVRKKPTMKKNKTIIKARRVIALTNRTGRRRRNPEKADQETINLLKKQIKTAKTVHDKLQKEWREALAAMNKEGDKQRDLTGDDLKASQARFKKLYADFNRIGDLRGKAVTAYEDLLNKYDEARGRKNPGARRRNPLGIDALRRKASYLRSQRDELSTINRSITILKKRIAREKNATTKNALRALMVEMQGTKYDLQQALRVKERAKALEKRSRRGRRNPKKLDAGTRGWILQFIRDAVKDGRTWAESKELIERSGFDDDVVKMAAGMWKQEESGKGKKKTASRMGINPAKKTRRKASTTRPRPNGVRETVRKFGGSRSNKKKAVSVQAPLSTPGTVGRLGRIKKIQLKSGRYYDFTDRKTAPYLATDSRNKLHVVGGKYRINPGSDQGEIERIIYEAQKPHLGHPEMAPYYHDFGEDDGRRPRLKIDPEGFMQIVGGNYSLEADGIHN